MAELTLEQIKALVDDAVMRSKQGQAGSDQPPPQQKFSIYGREYASREEAEAQITRQFQEQQRRLEELQSKLTAAPPAAPQQPTPSQVMAGSTWNKDAWLTDEFVGGDPRAAIVKALSHQIFGTHDEQRDVAKVIPAMIQALQESAKSVNELKQKVSDWELRAKLPYVPWDNQQLRDELTAYVKNNRLPDTSEGYEFAAQQLARQGKMVSRDQWAQQMQEMAARQQGNVVPMRPQGLPTVGQSPAMSADVPQEAYFEKYASLPIEEQEKILSDLKQKAGFA